MKTTVAAQRNIFRELVRRFADQHEDNTDFRKILVDARIALAQFTDYKETVDEDSSDGYHTFRELYRYRMLYNAAFFNMLARHTDIPVVKSRRHGDGEPCFGGGWFIVMAQLPTGQVSNHYEDRFWELFNVPEAEKAPEWDGHTPNDAADRLESFLEMREPDSDRSNPPGNAAAMREALEKCAELGDQIDDWLGSDEATVWNCRNERSAAHNIMLTARAALAAPPRNCDRFATPAEAHIAFQRFCRGNYRQGYASAGLDGCDDCELCETKNTSGEDACPFAWLFAPMKEN